MPISFPNGVSAGMLWTAQGAVLMAYPEEHRKGADIALFWMIFNFGAGISIFESLVTRNNLLTVILSLVIGSLVPLIQNVNSTANAVSDGTYIGFLVLTFMGAIFAVTLCNSSKITRSDGSRFITMEQPTWRSEFLGLAQCFKTDPYIIAFFPMFLASNWFYSYQFNDVNLARFNIRTRSLNNLMYWTAQILGSMLCGWLLDLSRFARRARAIGAFITIFLLTTAIWGGGLAFQLTYTHESAVTNKLDWADSGYAGPLVLYFFYGAFDAIWQTYVYWVMGALTNNARKLAFFAGFYKGIQSAGAAITFGLDSVDLPYMNMFASDWALLTASMVCALPVIFYKIKNHTEEDADLAFNNKSTANVHIGE